jgi:hypothetical protein
MLLTGLRKEAVLYWPSLAPLFPLLNILWGAVLLRFREKNSLAARNLGRTAGLGEKGSKCAVLP